MNDEALYKSEFLGEWTCLVCGARECEHLAIRRASHPIRWLGPDALVHQTVVKNEVRKPRKSLNHMGAYGPSFVEGSPQPTGLLVRVSVCEGDVVKAGRSVQDLEIYDYPRPINCFGCLAGGDK